MALDNCRDAVIQGEELGLELSSAAEQIGLWGYSRIWVFVFSRPNVYVLLLFSLLRSKMAKPFQGLSICLEQANLLAVWSARITIDLLPFPTRRKKFLSIKATAGCFWGFDVAVMVCLLIQAVCFFGIPRNARLWLKCNSGLVCDEYHLIFECQTLSQLRAKYCHLFTPPDSTVRQFMWQTDIQAVMLVVKEAFKILLSWFSRVHFLAVKGRLPPALCIKIANCLVCSGCTQSMPVIRQVVQ